MLYPVCVRMQFYQHYRRSIPICPSYHAVSNVVVGEVTIEGDRKTESEIRELRGECRSLKIPLRRP